MATLLAYFVTHAQNQALPQNRRQLLERSIWVLLRCGHRRKGAGIAEPDAAQRVLAALSLKLHEVPEEAYWSHEQLTSNLAALLEEPDFLTQRCWRPQAWQGPERFLELVSEQTGILAPADAAGHIWQFLHRQFHELLAAQALHEQSKRTHIALGDLVKTRILSEQHADVSRWAEVLGYACELDDKPLQVLTELAKLDGELALRVLPELEVVDPVEALEALGNTAWDGDFLRKLAARWLERGMPRANLIDWLWRQVKPARSIEQLSYFHYVLEGLLGEVDRERFFKLCKRPLPEGSTEMVKIPDGELVCMGSPDGEPGRSRDETVHFVRISTFQICPFAVTNVEYEQFDAGHQRELFEGRLSGDEAPNHPVVNVTWWQARLYCAWQGGRLPTEAEWEYACRAGTETPFSFGDNITPEQVNHDGIHPYAGESEGQNRAKTVSVGSLPPNAWGIHEMHGNVSEWCEDWYSAYPREDVNPKGPDTGTWRVLRGGSWGNDAWDSRSARRFGYVPGCRDFCFGFRLVRDR